METPPSIGSIVKAPLPAQFGEHAHYPAQAEVLRVGPAGKLVKVRFHCVGQVIDRYYRRSDIQVIDP